MSKRLVSALLVAACGAGFALAYSAAASAQQPQAPKERSIPDSFPWKYGPGNKPVKKSQVTINPDGSTREEVPLGGKCVRVVEKTAEGVKRTDHC